MLCFLIVITAICLLQTEGTTWEAIDGGNDTICAEGGPYSFMFRKGTSNNLAVFFEGGGACWDTFTCGIAHSCTTSIDKKYLLSSLNDDGYGGGLLKNEDNSSEVSPIADYNVLFIPYCSCDGHTGNSTVKYGFSTFHHWGKINADKALQYAYNIVPNPDTVFITGCSAGSVGSYIWSPWIMAHYNNSKHAHVGDSYVPQFGKNGWNEGVKQWKMVDALYPYKNASINPSEWRPTVAAELAADYGKQFPNAKFSSYTSNDDAVQTNFYHLEGGGDGTFTNAMRDALTYAGSHANNFGYFIASGYNHCISPYKGFFSTKVKLSENETVYLTDWYREVLSSDPWKHRIVDYKSGL